jgi:hypothetical protein
MVVFPVVAFMHGGSPGKHILFELVGQRAGQQSALHGQAAQSPGGQTGHESYDELVH